MRALFFFVSFLALTLLSIGQQTLPTNNLLLGYQEFPTTITSHTADGSGNQYYTGIFRGQLKVNNQVLATGNGLEDIFWVKTNANGQVQRVKTFGSGNSENAYLNSLAMGNSNMLFGFNAMETVQLGAVSFIPYTYTSSAFGSALVCVDTAGSVQWVRRTSLQNFRIYFADNVYHVIGLLIPAFPGIRFEDNTVTDSIGRSGIVHLMVDQNGNFLSAKTITARRSGQNISLFNAGFFSDKRLFFHLRVDGDSSIYINNSQVTIPSTFSNYHLFLRTDTAYSYYKTKILNPLRHMIAGVGNQQLATTVGPGDSIYSIYNHESNIAAPYTIDGFPQLPQRNTLYIMDSTLTVRRMVYLSSSFAGSYPLNMFRRRIYFRHLLVQNGQLYLKGIYTGINESPINAIATKDTLLTILPGVTTTIDQNGPSKSFLAKINLNGLNGSIKWYGDHSEYENMGVAPAALRSGGSNRMAFLQTSDNVWNPWLADENLNIITGSMRKNADRPEMPQMIKFFNDGSRVVIGFARGKTALDSNSSFTSNAGRRDIFITRLRPNNQVVWYKRFHSTLTQAEVRGLEVKNNKVWFLVNYLGTQNDSNFIKVDSAVYNVRVNASLMANIDTAGNLTVFNLTNPVLRPVFLSHFSFFNNGDLVIGTDNNNIVYQNFPGGMGSHLFRLHPVSGTILDARKFLGFFSPAINSIQVDKNDHIYLAGSSYYPTSTKISLHNGSTIIDSLQVAGNTGLQQTIWKLQWNKLHWAKRFSNGGMVSSGKQFGDLLLMNSKPLLAISPYTTNTPLHWDGQLVHNGVSVPSTTFVSLDTNGNMLRNKTLANISANFNRMGNNESIYVSGYLRSAATVDTIQLNFAGGMVDGIGLVLDSNLVAKRSFRVASPYAENMADMDIYKDSLVALAYTSQTNPQVYLNRTMIDAGDYEEDAYVGTLVMKSNVVTGINTPLPRFTRISIAPNPVINHNVEIAAQVTEPLRSLMTIYHANGQLITNTSVLLTPGTTRYSILLPSNISKGVYRLIISNKKWTATQSFLVL